MAWRPPPGYLAQGVQDPGWCVNIVSEPCRRQLPVSRALTRSCPPFPPSTAGLTDYEIRDLNDEINKLMREKGHWEKQIVALGGANYRRAGAMLDEDGKQVPGTRGYK